MTPRPETHKLSYRAGWQQTFHTLLTQHPDVEEPSIATRCADGSSAQVVCWTFEGADRHPGFPCNVVGHAGVYSKGHPVRDLSPMFGVGTGVGSRPVRTG
jgi:hypothetical protein